MDTMIHGSPSPKASYRLDEIIPYPIYMRLKECDEFGSSTTKYLGFDETLIIDYLLYANSFTTKNLTIGGIGLGLISVLDISIDTFSWRKTSGSKEILCKYILYPLSLSGDQFCRLYRAYNVNTETTDYAVGPDKVLEFASLAPFYSIAAANFSRFEQKKHDYRLSTATAGYYFGQDRYDEGWRAVGRSWLEAFQDPEWYLDFI